MLFSTSKMSARDRPLSKKEQEEEEMRNELAGMAFCCDYKQDF